MIIILRIKGHNSLLATDETEIFTDRKKMMQDTEFKIVKDNLISCIMYLVSFPFRVYPWLNS